jgi:hypothetical protein
VLNSLGERVRALGRADDVEVIVADWGSDVPLRQAIALEPAAAAIVSFVTIPPALARARQGDSAFPEVLALNAAARRARGRHIGRIDQDTIVGDRFLRWFFDSAPARAGRGGPAATTLWFANRRDIPFRFAARCPDRRHVDRLVRRFGRWLPAARGNRWFNDEYWSGSVGIWLAPSAQWQECGGYDERLIYYNWMETDMVRRLGQKYPLVDLGRLTGDDFYHLGHHDPRPPAAAHAHARKNPNIDRTGPVPPMCPNTAAWGLADCDLPRQPCAAPAVADRARPGLAGVRDAGVFARLVARVAVEMAADRLIVPLAHASVVTRRRIVAASRGLAGRPVLFWPGTLWKLWHGRKGNRAR